MEMKSEEKLVAIHVEMTFDSMQNLVSLKRNENYKNPTMLSSTFAVNCPQCWCYFNTDLVMHHHAAPRPGRTPLNNEPMDDTDHSAESSLAAHVNPANSFPRPIKEEPDDGDAQVPEKRQQVVAVKKKSKRQAAAINDGKEGTSKGTATAQRNFACEQCPASYINRAFLERHRKSKHTTKNQRSKMLICEDCGQSFGAQMHKLKHQAGHGLLKKYFCDKCKGGFWHKDLLKLHATKDCTDESKNFKCSVCYDRFGCKDHLRSHMVNLHCYDSSSAPHACATCGKGFLTQTKLERHMHTHE